MEFMTKLYRARLERGAHFPRERPASTFSRQEPCAVELLSQPEVESGVGHVCWFGMRVPVPAFAGGGTHLVRKPTRRASSSPE
eukprot:12764032-Alexandrium_andersonii.AAC.1